MLEPVSFGIIATLVAPFLQKGAEKVAEQTVELVFKNHQTIAEKYRNLFSSEIISLGLNEAAAPAEIEQKLKEKPEVKAEIEKKIATNQELLNEMIEAFNKTPQAGSDRITINAGKIGQIISNPTGPITITNTF